MLEIPESKTISLQTDKTLVNKTIAEVITASSPHKYAFFSGDPAEYPGLLKGKHIKSTHGHGMFVDMHCDDDICISIGDGTNIRYYPSAEECPAKYQLLIKFDDGGCVAFTVAMYGGIWAYRGEFDNPYHRGSLKSISPLEEAFDEFHFNSIYNSTNKNLSLKALLATEQRIPGLGNGVLQDILFNAGIHPKRKKSTLSDFEKAELF
jgi:formamidopyrimidine-DNA glycosylase